MASSVDRRIEGYLSRDMRQRDPAGLIRPRSTEPIRACGQVPRHQAGHMTAIGLRCRHAEKSLRAGGHPHMSRGDFRNNGREYRPQGNPEEVRVHDFLIKELGRAVPYGIYDLAANS